MMISLAIARLAQINVPQRDLDIPKATPTNGTIIIAMGVVFSVAGAVALLVIVLSALKYTLSQGDPQETAKAKNSIIYAAIGLVISILAFSIVRFIAGRT
jgi:hypothetical protein